MGPKVDDVDSIFCAAIELPSLIERMEYLERACGGDRELRHRVEELLAAHFAAGSFLERSPAADLAATTDTPTIAEGPGTVLGPYKLLQQIGEGAFGVVFIAEQTRPVRRRVALKIIKPGMDTREVIGRFEAERQALAMMDHPNIAKVHDAGATENGRPYFVMELIQGVPITDYCDQCNLSTRERLELFITVCQAVQHAHQKGVIHRDIKPTNVLVAIQDGQPAPKIIDFGVAKAINQQLTEHTLMTAFAHMVGTPLYMSPEQAELSPLGVDTRSDIYSLGALLYELLTSVTPFDKDRLHRAPYDELRRIIREEEPPRPSARISTLAADLALTVAEHRRTDTRRLRLAVRGELDWIVMKCLEKDRNRRYESAGSLGRDVERYLHDEPVQACPPSAAYRLRKFIRRNKVAAAFVLLLAAASGALAVSNVQTRNSERRAVTENAKALAVSNLLQGMLRSANPDEAKDAEYTVRQLLDDFSASFRAGLADQPEVEAEIRATIGRAYWRLGLADKAEPHLMKALELRRQKLGRGHQSSAEVLVDVAWCRNEQGRLRDAEDAAREALGIYRARGTTGSPLLRASAVLQRVLISLGRLEAAESETEKALAQAHASGTEFPEIAVVLHGQADLLIQRGRFREAELAARKAVDLHRRVHGPGHPETAWGLLALGRTLHEQRKFSKAEEALREALGIFRERYRHDHHSLGSTLNILKQVLEARGDRAALEALASEKAIRPIVSDAPRDDLRLAEVVLSDNSQVKIQEARRLIRHGMEGLAQVPVDFPDQPFLRLNAVGDYINVIRICGTAPDFTNEVAEANRRLDAELQALVVRFPDSGDCQWQSAMLYRGWAAELSGYSDYLPLAERAYEESLEILNKLSHADPERRHLWYSLANSYASLGDIQWRSGRADVAEPALRRAMEIYDTHATEITSDLTPDVALEIAVDYLRRAYILATTGREKEAARLVREVALNAPRLTEPVNLANAFYYLAIMQLRLGDKIGYRDTFQALGALLTQTPDELTDKLPIWTLCLAPISSDDPLLAVKLADKFIAKAAVNERLFGLLLSGAAHYRAGQYELAAQHLQESIDAYLSGTEPIDFHTISYQRLFLAMNKWQQGQQDVARALLTSTLPMVDEDLQSPMTLWNRRATLEILRREAEALIGQRQKNEAVENESRTNNDQNHVVRQGKRS